MEFLEIAGGTEVILTHKFLPDEEQRENHRGGWNGCLRNLEKALQKIGKDEPEFEYVTYISTSPETLWNALTDPELTEKYLAACERVRLEGRLQVGASTLRQREDPRPGRKGN